MITLAIRCDAVPGKEEEFDNFATTIMKDYWTKQPGVTSYSISKDLLVGYPERVIHIDVRDMAALEKSLQSNEWKNHRRTFLSLVSTSDSQVLSPMMS